MKTRIAQHLIRVARRLDPNSCVDFRPLPTVPTVINVHTSGNLAQNAWDALGRRA